MSETAYDASLLPDLLPIYYKKIFPCGSYYQWMNYGGDDIYIRYLSFADQSEFEKELLRKCPYKIDIGAVFTHKPKDHKTVKATAFQAIEKELVFDIDMTDYDDVRSCCTGADICKKCWPLMTMAIKIIDITLRDDFGFEHILWVYSGRRGVHCWVCDETARKLSQNARSAIADFFTVVKGGDNQQKKVNLSAHVHPAIQRALVIIREHFDQYAVYDQNFLGTDEKLNQMLALVPDESVRETVVEYLSKFDQDKLTSENRWKTFQKAIEVKLKTADIKESKRLAHLVDEIQLQYCYPRLDVNVSKTINHLLKSPFCVHPKTGRVCVPIDAKNVDAFDPFSVPTISQLCSELDEIVTTVISSDEVTTAKKRNNDTSLKESLVVFERFLRGLEKSWKGKLAENG